MVLFKTIILQFNDWVPLSLSADVSAITARTTDVFAYEKIFTDKEITCFQK